MNRFRDPTMRAQYDAAVKAFEVKHRNLFMPNGERRRSPNMGSSFATYFWKGFDGAPQVGIGNFTDADSRKTVAYAYWRAGQDMAKRKAA